MICPHCKKHFTDEGRAKGGRAKKHYSDEELELRRERMKAASAKRWPKKRTLSTAQQENK